MGMWRDRTPRKDDEITRPAPGPVNPAGNAPGMSGHAGCRPACSPTGPMATPSRRRTPKAS
jgi:hypothetical protein